MYTIPVDDLESVTQQVHLRLEDMTRIKGSRKWWSLPYVERRDLPQALQTVISVFENTVDKQIVKKASADGLKVVWDGLSVLWIEDFISMGNHIAALIRIPPPQELARIFHSLSKNDDTWKGSVFERHFRRMLETSQTDETFDVETLRKQLRLVARTPDETDVTLNAGDVLVLERENRLEVREGGFPVILFRYRIEQREAEAPGMLD